MVFLEIAIAILAAAVVYLVIKNLQWRMRFEQRVKDWLAEKEKDVRADAAARSGRVLSGKVLEKLVPFLKDFPYDPHDIRWLGDPIDLVIFDGYSADGVPNKIVFCEVKSGESKLSKIQNRIKELIAGKKVEWKEFRVR